MCPKVSVIMPVYNPDEEWLKDAITSILKQTYSDFELLIINDGLENNIENICKTFNDDRIKYFKNEQNFGLPKTLNKGISLANGEFIARMDQDDISLETRFEKQVSFLEQNKEISLVGSWIKYFPNEKLIKHPQNPSIFDFLKECTVSHPVIMFRKSDFEKYDLKYDESLYTAEDYDLWARAIKVLNFANIQEVLLNYRISSGSMTAKRKKEQLEIGLRIKQNLLNSISKDKSTQKKLIKLVEDDLKIQKTFIQKIFSIKKVYSIDKTYKLLTILGISFKIFPKRFAEVINE